MNPTQSTSAGPNRPSLARTSISASTAESPRNWEESDIRGDLAAGWGNNAESGEVAAAPSDQPINDWGWKLSTEALRPLPPFYPLDQRSTRKLLLANGLTPFEQGGELMPDASASTERDLHFISAISQRISNACRHLSIQVEWDNDVPCATLLTMEMVEIVISMYLGGDEGGIVLGGNQSEMVHSISPTPGPKVLLIELQRRKGDIVAFYNYRRALLDAAEGKFDFIAFDKKDGITKPGGRDRANQPRATLSRPTMARPKAMRPPSLSANDADTLFAGLKKEMDSFEEDSFNKKSSTDEQNDIIDKALEALNIAASLIKKDRVDAQRLGMESLVLLTDPLRAGIDTAKIASRVVLLGSAREDVAMGIDNEDDLDALFDESAGLGIRETILEMIIGDSFEGKVGKDDIHDTEIDREFRDILFNLGLSVLSNALHTLGESSESSDCPTQPGTLLSRSCNNGDNNDDRKPAPSASPNRRRAATEPVNKPSDLNAPKRFIDDTSASFGCDVLSALIRILGQAKSKPHDAYHSARCLDVLFKGGGNGHRARARRDLDAKRIVSAALEVGARSHAKLESASRVALVSLVTDDELSMEEEKTEIVEHGQQNDGIEEMENVEKDRNLP